MNSAGRISISSCFQHGLQDGYIRLKPHVKGGLFPLTGVCLLMGKHRERTWHVTFCIWPTIMTPVTSSWSMHSLPNQTCTTFLGIVIGRRLFRSLSIFCFPLVVFVYSAQSWVCWHPSPSTSVGAEILPAAISGTDHCTLKKSQVTSGHTSYDVIHSDFTIACVIRIRYYRNLECYLKTF